LAPYAVRSYRTLSPLPVPLRAIGGLLSVALAVGSRRPGVTWHSALWSPDFPRCACARRDCPADSIEDCSAIAPTTFPLPSGEGARRCIDSHRCQPTLPLIQKLARRATDRRRELGGLRRRQFLAQDREDALAFGKLRIGFLAAAGDEDHAFAALLVRIVRHAFGELRQRLVEHRLEQLGEFARQHRLTPVAEHRAHVGQALGDAMRGFVEDQRARL